MIILRSTPMLCMVLAVHSNVWSFTCWAWVEMFSVTAKTDPERCGERGWFKLIAFYIDQVKPTNSMSRSSGKGTLAVTLIICTTRCSRYHRPRACGERGWFKLIAFYVAIGLNQPIRFEWPGWGKIGRTVDHRPHTLVHL